MNNRIFPLIIRLSAVLCLSLLIFAAGLAAGGRALAAEPLTLLQAVQAGLENNSTLQASRLDLEKAELDVKLAQRSFFPDLNLSYSYTRLDEGPEMPVIDPTDQLQPIKMVTQPPDNYSTRLSLQQPLYLGGRLWAGMEQAHTGQEMAKIQLEKAEGDLILQVINSYYGVLMAGERVEIEKEALELIREHKRIARVSFEQGMVLKTDLLQVEIEEGKAELSLQEAKNNLLMARKSLTNLIGRDVVDLQFRVPEIEPDVELDLKKLTETARTDRAELKLMTLNRQLTETGLKMEKSSRLPSLMLIGNYNWQGSELSFEEGSWNVTLSGSLSLFDSGKSGARQEKIEKELARIDSSSENLKQMLALEVENKLLEVKNKQSNLELQKLNLEKAEENYRLESKRYELGIGSSVNLLNAETMLKQSKVGRMMAEYQYQLSLFDLLHKMGKLNEYVEGVMSNEK